MDNSYMFGRVTVNEWITIILIVWGIAIVVNFVACLITRINRKKRGSKEKEVPGLCMAFSTICGIVGGVCALNLVGNALKIDLGFAIVLVLFLSAGIIGGTSYQIGKWIIGK